MRIRTSLAATGLAAVAALALTGCGGDDDKGDGGTKQSPSASASAPGGSPGKVDSASLQGSWAGKTAGTSVNVTVTGTAVTLTAQGTSCDGEVADHGATMLAMKCSAESGRTMGTVASADAAGLVVDWGNGLTDRLAKTG
ncbi:hypothetical protein [Streptomyces clavuligerus]|uniref:Lipoprotein n=1 Tax=Streptomyces clavuligerus TaxID=1901 RepID=B5GPD6_STRCL|nr:hypothetical protein [Streptomyces clavuligerus]ANW19664.1 hypothetical protein BB341_16270 [Streptomyces clavuligerus]AXU14276.1 hypothetical protein D1794_16985 [Streptomyces clavuligerus]EDY48182.1 hypothetical protein SSCG_01463 [Streptomyces clavuligerus]EFG07504.1 Hypothetical protein SCLAV_2431 [Streptomyces clavuligerus]MBY6304277.1 hypothetical protein [Streptomyces clavuligerus]